MNFAKNYVKNQSEKKQKLIRTKKRLLKETKVSNRISFLFPIIAFFIFLGTFIYLIIYQENDVIASMTDFAIAVMSTAVLMLTFLKEGLTKSQKYIWWSGVYIFLPTIGLIVFIIIGSDLHNAGNIARIISFLGLVFTIAKEIVTIIKFDYDYGKKKEEKQESNIESIENQSITHSYE